MSKYTIAMDFDGVIHGYSQGWKGVANIYDLPVPGVKEFIDDLRKDYKVVIFSSRCSEPDGLFAVIQWLDTHRIIVDDVVAHKPSSLVLIDDRCICFNGKFDFLIDQIKSFKSWYKQDKQNKQNKIPIIIGRSIKECNEISKKHGLSKFHIVIKPLILEDLESLLVYDNLSNIVYSYFDEPYYAENIKEYISDLMYIRRSQLKIENYKGD